MPDEEEPQSFALHQALARRFVPCSFIDTWTSESAAGVTPGMRLAWPMVMGRTRSSVLAHLAREAADGAVLDPVGNGDGFGGLEFFDRFLLLLKVAGELDLGFDGAGFVAKSRAFDGGPELASHPIFSSSAEELKIGWGTQTWKIVAEGGEERLDGDFRALEQLRPGEAGGRGLIGESGGPQVSQGRPCRVVSRFVSAAMRACFCSYSAQTSSLMRPRRRPCGVRRRSALSMRR